MPEEGVKNAAQDVCVFEAHYGQLHTVVGDARSGKSALVDALINAWRKGIHQVEVPCIQGKEMPPRKDAKERPKGTKRAHALSQPAPGIGGVQVLQAPPMVVEGLSVLENVLLGQETTCFGFLSTKRIKGRMKALCAQYGLEITPKTRVRKADADTRMEIALLRMLCHDGDLLVFDEVDRQASQRLLQKIEGIACKLADEGRAVLWVTQSVEAAWRLGDAVTVLCGGKVAKQAGLQGCTRAQMNALLGREGKRFESAYTPGRTILVLRNGIASARGNAAGLDNVSLTLCAGERVAVLALEGNGAETLVDVLIGKRRLRKGQLFLDDEEITGDSMRERYELGIAHVPKAQRAVIGEMRVKENMVLRTYATPRFSGYGLLRGRKINAFARERCEEFGLTSIHGKAKGLTDMEVFRLTMARETVPGMRLLLVQEPTVGIPQCEQAQVHKLLAQACTHKHAMLLVTRDVREALALAERIVVLRKGRIVTQMETRYASARELRMYMTKG